MTAVHAQTERRLDPITFEVLRHGFEYASERMSQVLQKASFSPIIYDMVDYSNAIFDPDVELIGQTANCPVHIAAMHFSARASLARFPLAELRPEDIVILNDPYQGHAHPRCDADHADLSRGRAPRHRGEPRALDGRRRQPRHTHRR